MWCFKSLEVLWDKSEPIYMKKIMIILHLYFKMM